jgi:hypothetical protein
LLDRLEERLRCLSAVALAPPGAPLPDPGPEPTAADVPPVRPSDAERVRLLALMKAHEQVEQRLTARRRRLKQAEHYHLGAS